MNKTNFTNLLKSAKSVLAKRSPEILTGLGIAGMVTTTVLAVKATPKATKLIEAKKEELEVESLTPVETIKTCWKCYVPATVTGVMSITCLIGASSVNLRRNTALATAYKISETALTEYKEKVVETIGEKKEEALREKIVKDKVDKNPVSKNEVIITNQGNTLCYDVHSGRYFNSDIDHIKNAKNELNRQMVYNEYVSLNDFYDELGLGHTDVGNELGWRLDGGLIDISFSSHLADNGQPCIAINYSVAPKRDYYKLF